MFILQVHLVSFNGNSLNYNSSLLKFLFFTSLSTLSGFGASELSLPKSENNQGKV